MCFHWYVVVGTQPFCYNSEKKKIYIVGDGCEQNPKASHMQLIRWIYNLCELRSTVLYNLQIKKSYGAATITQDTLWTCAEVTRNFVPGSFNNSKLANWARLSVFPSYAFDLPCNHKINKKMGLATTTRWL